MILQVDFDAAFPDAPVGSLTGAAGYSGVTVRRGRGRRVPVPAA